MKICLTAAVLTFAVWLLCPQQRPPNPEEFLRVHMQLSTNQIANIRKGKAVAQILKSAKRSDIFVFGGVYIHAKPTAYLELMSDMGKLKKMPGYLGAGQFSEPPQVGDMEGFSLDPNDVADLRKCKPGNCELQLPEESMDAVRKSIDWTDSDVTQQINNRAERDMIGLLHEYRRDGDRALGTYQDKPHPLPVAQQFSSLLSRLEFFAEYMPDLNRYLLDYPNSRPDGTRDFFYWEKVNFGLKPTVRLNHAITYRFSGSERDSYVLAIKQLYASHYFQTALDLSFCVRDPDSSEDKGFYLITVKASRQAGLTGLKGGLVRKVVVGKTRSSLERALNNIRNTLEHSSESQPSRNHESGGAPPRRNEQWQHPNR
jgi:hypothetical protein